MGKTYLAVVDSTYMTIVPPKYTAYQGFDALFRTPQGSGNDLHPPTDIAITTLY